MSSQGRSGDFGGLTRINFNYIDDSGNPVQGEVVPTMSFGNNTWTLDKVNSIAIENEYDVTISYSDVDKYLTPGNSMFYTDGSTKDLDIVYKKIYYDANGHNYVDLGLSVYWAVCNIGATKEEEFGNYYSWGTTIANKVSNYSNHYKFYELITQPRELPITQDTARKLWGGDWRMPTGDELRELLTLEHSWTQLNGVNGFKFTSGVDKDCTLFLPASGYWGFDNTNFDTGSAFNQGSQGNYWSSTCSRTSPTYNMENYYDSYVQRLRFGSTSEAVGEDTLSGVWNAYSYPVRPVLDKQA